MLACINCGKRPHQISWSRHKKGSSGATEWPLKGPVTKRTQNPNLHNFKGEKFCTKCIRIAKKDFQAKFQKTAEVTQAAV